MQFSTLGIILVIVAVICLVALFFFISAHNSRRLRQDRLRYLLELESEALASEQTGPMAMNVRSKHTGQVSQNIPAGLILKNHLFAGEQTSQKNNGQGNTGPGRLQPFFDYIDLPLSWNRAYLQEDGERFDLRPTNGGPVIAIIEWHGGGWASARKAYAQVGDQYYILTENLFNRIKVLKTGHNEMTAHYNRTSSEVKFFGNRMFRWVISNPLEKPCAFVDQDGIEALIYTGSMSNIRIRNSNLDIIPVLLLLLIYEYHKDLDGAEL